MVPSVSGTATPDALLDPAVLRCGDLLGRGGVEVEDGEDDDERLVLPDGDVVQLAGERLAQRDRVARKPGLRAFDHRRAPGPQARGAEAEDRIIRVRLRGRLLVLELDDEVDDEPVRRGADVGAAALDPRAVRRAVGVDGGVRGRGALALRLRPLVSHRLRRGRIWRSLGLDEAVDVA